jgi:hypothetical protein
MHTMHDMKRGCSSTLSSLQGQVAVRRGVVVPAVGLHVGLPYKGPVSSTWLNDNMLRVDTCDLSHHRKKR